MAVLSFFCMVGIVGVIGWVGLLGEGVHAFSEFARFVRTKGIVNFLKGKFLLLFLGSRNRIVWSEVEKKILVYATVDNKVVNGIRERFKSIRVPPIADRKNEVNLLFILDIIRSRKNTFLLQHRSELALNQGKILAEPSVDKRTDSINILYIVILRLRLVTARLRDNTKLRLNIVDNLRTHDINMICVLLFTTALGRLTGHFIASLLENRIKSITLNGITLRIVRVVKNLFHTNLIL